jgi:cytochrome P450
MSSETRQTDRKQRATESTAGQIEAVTDDAAAAEYPKPPYPSHLGPPALHIVHQMRDRLKFLERVTMRYDLARTRMLGQDFYGLGHPEYFKRVLLTDREKFRKSDDFRIAFGEGLLTVEGEEWQQQRNTLQPFFARDAVMSYADGMVEQIRRRADTWEDGQRFDLQAEFTKMTLDVIMATVLGRELDLHGDERLREAAEHLHEWFVPSSYFLPHLVPTPARRRFHRAKETIGEEADRLLQEAATDAPTDPTEADDLLSLLVGIREAGMSDSAMLSDERLRDQMVTIIFAGHDTTTGTLTFAFWALANHPEIREQFHAEVDQLDGPPTLEDVEDLEMTERVITETLRLYPPVYSLPRETATDIVIDGYYIPEGEQVALDIRDVQRDARFFEDPHEFRPSRWDGDLRSDLHDFAYAPFGGGPRICIGREFALLEAKLTLATVGRRFDFEWRGENVTGRTGTEPPTAPEMTLRMDPGQEFRVHER